MSQPSTQETSPAVRWRRFTPNEQHQSQHRQRLWDKIGVTLKERTDSDRIANLTVDDIREANSEFSRLMGWPEEGAEV